jgi:hypothetical protein
LIRLPRKKIGAQLEYPHPDSRHIVVGGRHLHNDIPTLTGFSEAAEAGGDRYKY